jgi:hypothetical protein
MSNRRAPSGVCQCCGEWVEYLELDHIIPRFEDGANDTANLQWLCKSCHLQKSIIESSRVDRKGINKGSIHTLEHNAKIAATLVGNTRASGNKGKPKSPEHRAKIGESNRGIPKSSEHKAKLSAAHMGLIPSEETRAKMSQSRTGKRHTEETKIKMSIAQTKRYSKVT